jgi:hypothetical protein
VRSRDYLITTAHGVRSRRFIWNSHEPVSVENQDWYLENTSAGVRVLHRSAIHLSQSAPRPIHVDQISLIYGSPMELPCDPFDKNSRKFILSVKLLTPLRAAYLPTPGFKAGQLLGQRLESPREQLYYIFSGVRYFLNDFHRVELGFTGYIEKTAIFTVLRGPQGFQLNVLRENLTFKIQGEKRRIFQPGEIALITEERFVQGSLQWGKHWWRLNRISAPEAIIPNLLDRKSNRDQVWLNRISTGIAGILISLAVTVHSIPPIIEKKEVSRLTVDLTKLKAPKVIPALPKPIETPKPLPIPTPVKTPEVKLTPKPTPKPEPKKQVKPPKPEPAPKKVVKEKARELPKLAPPKVPPPRVTPPLPAPPKQKVSPPPVAPPAPQRPPAPVAPPAPTAAQIQAKEQAQAQSQLAKSLGFLSNLKNKVPLPSIYGNTTSDKYSSSAKGLPSGRKSSVIKDLASNSTSDTAIDTKSTRSIGGSYSGDPRSRKKLNGVQGTVRLSRGGEGGLGSSLSSQEFATSGVGQISQAAVEKALAGHLAKFQHCYEKALITDSSLSGTIVMQWTISTAGQPSGIKVVRSEMNNSFLHDCISKEIGTVRFPSPKGGPVSIKYPFAFTPSSL